jgi:hypothetical protein
MGRGSYGLTFYHNSIAVVIPNNTWLPDFSLAVYWNNSQPEESCVICVAWAIRVEGTITVFI